MSTHITSGIRVIDFRQLHVNEELNIDFGHLKVNKDQNLDPTEESKEISNQKLLDKEESDKSLKQKLLDQENYEKLFKEKLQELIKLITNEKNNDIDNPLSVWEKTLKNLTNINFKDDSYEDRIIEIFKEKRMFEFEFRAHRLNGLYVQLKEIFKFPELIQEYRIKKIRTSIIKRQKELQEFHLKLSGKDFNFINLANAWKIFYKKTLKYVTDEPEKDARIQGVLSIWRQTISLLNQPMLYLRSLAFGFSFLNEFTLKTKSFEEIFGILQTMTKESSLNKEFFDEKKLKEFYQIFCWANLDLQMEEKIFNLLAQFSKSKKEPLEILFDFKAYRFNAFCKRLVIMEKFDVNTDLMMEQLKNTLKSLGEFYSNGLVEKKVWDDLCDTVCVLPISKAKRQELLTIFLSTKKIKGPASTISDLSWKLLSMPVTFVNACKKYWISSTQDGEQSWKGNKYLILLSIMQYWIEKNRDWINEKLGENQNNGPVLQEKIKKFINSIEMVKFPVIGPDATLDERKKYNSTLRELRKAIILNLRAILTDEECQDAIHCYFTLSPWDGGGCTEVLLKFCENLYVGSNMVPFTIKNMIELTYVGLKLLSEKDTCYKPYLKKEFFPHILGIGPNVIHEAIGAIPASYKTPLLSLLGSKIQNAIGDWDPNLKGAPPFNLLELTVKQRNTTEKQVTWLRFATPTNEENKIIPEFQAFLRGKRSLMISLQNSTGVLESKRTQALLSLNDGLSTNFVCVFPLENSDFFKQTGKYADHYHDKPLYETRVSFLNAITQKIIPDGNFENFNASEQYTFPRSWLRSSAFKALIKNCQELTWDVFFGDAQVLNQEKRAIFIILFNVVLAIELMKHTGVEYFAFLCNHSSDRTGIFVTLLLKILLIKFDRENEVIDETNPEQSHTWNAMMTALVDGVPIIIAKREMNDFYESLTKVLDFLKDDNVRKRLKNSHLFSITNFKFPFSNPEKKQSDKKSENNNNSKSSLKMESYMEFPNTKNDDFS